MAEPTFTQVVGNLQTVAGHDKINSGVDAVTTYGYQNYFALRDVEGNEVHLILGTGAPSDDDTYDSAPLSSIYFNLSGGDGVSLYVKEETGATGWAAVSTGAAA